MQVQQPRLIVRTPSCGSLWVWLSAAFFFAHAALAVTPDARQVIAQWNEAVHAAQRPAAMAILHYTSDEDGIAGKIDEWVTRKGNYHEVRKRSVDELEIVITPQEVRERDWNGFVRNLAGRQGKRLRTKAFEQQVLAFGPPKWMARAKVSESRDRRFEVLRVTPPGGVEITWYIDPTTSLPAKSIQPGNDTEITITYDDWGNTGGTMIPHRERVEETGIPEHHLQLGSVQFEDHAGLDAFVPPQPGPSDTTLARNVPSIPFNFENSHIIFNASVNGRTPIGFLLDTGADQEVINEPRLSDFGLKTYGETVTFGGGGSAKYSYAQGASFTLPGVEIRNQHVAVLDQTGLEHALGMKLGGILGYDFISRFVIEINYQKQLITLHDPKNWKYFGRGYIIPVTFDNGVPFTNGTISVSSKTAVIPAHLVLDFGAAETMTLTSGFVKANNLIALAGTNNHVDRRVGLEKQFFAQNNVRGRIQQLALGKMVVESIPINMSVNTQGAYASTSFAGTIGEGIFCRYHVFLDYSRSRIILEPTSAVDTPFPEKQTYGLSLLAYGSDLRTYKVMSVLSGSPAESDGFKEGDVVSVLDGKPAAQLSLGDLDRELGQTGKEHQVQVLRNKERVVIRIKVRLISLDQK